MAGDVEDDLDPELDAVERERLARVSAELDRDRPVPGAGFRGELGRHLLDAGAANARHRPLHLWATVGGLAVAGLALLGVAAGSIL